MRLGARSLVVDVVMHSPARFSDAVRTAVESQLGAVGPTAVRARFDLRFSSIAMARRYVEVYGDLIAARRPNLGAGLNLGLNDDVSKLRPIGEDRSFAVSA